jgi:hypothetical protein
LTIIPIVKQFAERHGIADMVVVDDAGMLSASNLRDLDEAGLRFIVGSLVTKAPKDLESHFRWHGTAFTDGQVIDTITPRDQRGTAVKTSDPKVRAEPIWDPGKHAKSWRAVGAYSTKRAVRDNKTLTLQENKARAVVAGEKTARTPRFVKTRNGDNEVDEPSLARARGLVGLKGYVTNIEASLMPAGEGSPATTTCGMSSSPSGCRRPIWPPGRCSTTPARQSRPTSRSCSQPSRSPATCRTQPG